MNKSSPVMSVNSVENLSLRIWLCVVTQIETFKHSNNRALFTIYHTFFSRNHNSFEAKNHPAFQICSALNHNVVVTMHCQFLYYIGYPRFPPHTGGLHECIVLRLLPLPLTMLLSAEPSPELVRERVGGMCVKLGVLYWLYQPPVQWPL